MNHPHNFQQLTERESTILSQLSQGYANKEIATNLAIAVPTVRTHLRSIYEKIHVRSRTEAIVKYFRQPMGAGASPALRHAQN